MNIGIILLGAVFMFLLFRLFSNVRPLSITIKSRGENYSYLAMKKTRRRGYHFNDWNYYDFRGEEVMDERLKKIIHASFENEDWYGDFTFYAEDVDYLEVKEREDREAERVADKERV